MSCYKNELGDLQNPVFWRDVAVEAICSFMLVFFLLSNQLVYSDSFQATPTHAGLLMGFLVFAIVETFGHMSGAHMNPAVTLLFLLKRDITFSRTLLYFISQVAGGAAGAGCIYAFATPEKRMSFVPMQPAAGLSLVQGIGIEVVLTFFLCTVIQGSGDRLERNHPCPVPGLPVGLMVTVDIMAGATWTGAAMNPLIALGPEVVTGVFDKYWVYWVGPFIGTIISFFVYSLLSVVKKKYNPVQTHDEEEKQQSKERLDELAELLTGLLSKKKDEMNGNSKYIMEKMSNL